MGFTDDDVRAPEELRTDDLVLRPIRASDAELDHEAVMESRDTLRKWEQSSWPEDDFTVEANREDLQQLERRHAAGESFTYTVMDPTETRCLGCVYVLPTDGRQFAKYRVTAVADARWSRFEVGAYFWVRDSELSEELDRRLLDVLRRWFPDQWGIESVLIVTNEQLEQQVTTIERAGLRLMFELASPDEPARSLAYS